jgi:sugar lactone lactonase YvrE
VASALSLHWLIQGFRTGLLTIAITASSLFSQTMTSQATLGTGRSTVLGVRDSQEANESIHIYGPGVLAADAQGNVYVAVNDGAFKLDPSGIRVRVAGIKRGWRYLGDGGPAISTGVNARSVAVDNTGDLYIADAANNRVRKVDVATGIITTVAGDGSRGYSGDGGLSISAQLDGPTGVAVDTAGNLYIADGTRDGNNRIRRVVATTGVITTVAGIGSHGSSGDEGPATLAQFASLGGLATDTSGNLYIADNFNNRVRMVSAATGIITTVAGIGVAGSAGDGGLATNAELNNPLSVAVDSAGNLYIADSGNYRIRKVTVATGTINTVWNGSVVYRKDLHTYPCALALDAAGNLYIADSGVSEIRRVPPSTQSESGNETETPATIPLRSHATAGGFQINVTYDASVPAAAQAAFESLVSTYESVFTTNITVNIDVTFGQTGLGESSTEQIGVSYSAWRAAMIANANANPDNNYAVAAAASLPESDPIGNGTIFLNTANARALGFTANTAVDSTLTFSNSSVFEYNGVAASGAADFKDVAAHELDEGLGIGSVLTGLANNAPIPSGDYVAEDYFRYSAAGTRAITTNPSAFVYFSNDDGNTNVAQFNQAYSAEGDSDLDRNDWVYGNTGCPAANPHVQDAIICDDQAVPVGSGPEITVLNALGYDSGTPQTITFSSLGNVTFGVAPFSITATASSGLAVSFTSTTTAVCAISASTVTVIAAGMCSITASQPGNSTYSAAPTVTRSFTVNKAAQTITFGATGNVALGTSPFSINATSTSGLTVAFASNTTRVCTVNGNVVTLVATGTCSITSSQTGNANYTAAPTVTQTFTVNQSMVSPVSVNPGAGSATTQTFTFKFEDPNGYADLAVLDVLINNSLDGIGACYVAFAPASASSGYLYLVDDAGDGGYASGSPISLPSSSTLQNSQCTISGAGSSVSASGNTLTLTLAITFASGFGGNKIFYTAARNNTQNSGWQALGTWDVPGPAPVGPAVGGVTPARSASTGQPYTFTFTDTNGYGDLAVTDVLINNFLDGIGACYVAFAPTSATSGYLYLVDDAGDGGYASGSPMALPSSSTLQNGQCTINGSGSSVTASGNTLTLNLAIAFSSSFTGNRVFYLAARNNSIGNSGWQAVGSVTVP